MVDKTGRKIRLTRTQYAHVLRHKGMEQYLEEMKETLQHPAKVVLRKEGGVADYYVEGSRRKPRPLGRG